MKKLTVEATIDNLCTVIGFVSAELEPYECPPDLQGQIDMAVEEIFINIANYSYHPGSGKVSIGISAGEEAVIRFEDTGKPYNPMKQPDPELDKPLSEREIGGLGVFLVKQLMDEIEYTRLDNKNVLIIRKRIS